MSYKPLGEIMVTMKKAPKRYADYCLSPRESCSWTQQASFHARNISPGATIWATQAVPQLEPNKYSLARKLQALVQVSSPALMKATAIKNTIQAPQQSASFIRRGNSSASSDLTMYRFAV